MAARVINIQSNHVNDKCYEGHNKAVKAESVN
jgi:hypothetical protein